MNQNVESLPHEMPPMAIGRFFDASGQRQLLPYSALEVERARRAVLRVLGTFHFRTASNLLVTSQFDEGAQLMAAERAIMAYGMVVVSADSTPWDAARVESILRRFSLVGALGVSEATLDGLQRLGFDPLQMLRGLVVWARPGAYERLLGKPGLKVFRWLELGPATAIECSAGSGAHIDRFEWQVSTSEEGEILLDSRLERSQRFSGYRTGMFGKVVHGTCLCGNADPRIVPNQA
ncbi:TPA: hypothetical protein ACJX8E_004205 [Pseudomonas aeruginosa]